LHDSTGGIEVAVGEVIAHAGDVDPGDSWYPREQVGCDGLTGSTRAPPPPGLTVVAVEDVARRVAREEFTAVDPANPLRAVGSDQSTSACRPKMSLRPPQQQTAFADVAIPARCRAWLLYWIGDV
jgi:hypothetical protein